MVKEGKFFILIIFFLHFISASCNSTQININTASVEELDKLTGIGPVYAGRIVEMRPFNSVEDLINVSGIGEATLNKIKSQGLACIEEEIVKNETINEVEKEAIKTEEENIVEEIKIETINLTPITLNSVNSKDIKSEDNKEILKRNLSFYGIISFCIVFGVLFLLNKRKNRNEFRE
jgi:competence ComEA-like helix-hairpin-helix protein